MTLALTVPDMACSACAETITKAVTALDPAAQVQADPKTKQVNIETQADAAVVKNAITAAGYTVNYKTVNYKTVNYKVEAQDSILP
jgi:copper chaperone